MTNDNDPIVKIPRWVITTFGATVLAAITAVVNIYLNINTLSERTKNNDVMYRKLIQMDQKLKLLCKKEGLEYE